MGPVLEKIRGALIKTGLVVVAATVLGAAAWAWVTLSYTYSDGERAGYIQKLSHKGWVCKTWEGELSMINYPGAAPEIFHFSVRDDATARQIDSLVGKRVALHYEQHIMVPTRCFGDTEYFVTGVRVVE